ncbi:HAD family phosphatase [Candidatus Woesearchaeota archaeon]|nr:HAD family phosphatase [Candidatus Woesearchaeota archaeon]
MRYSLICFDMDGVLFSSPNFWLGLHKRLGTYAEGKRLTEQYLHTDYQKLVEEVVGRLWKGKDAAPYFALIKESRYIWGARETLAAVKKLGIPTAIITSGPKDLALRAQKELGVDYIFANELVVKNSIITGEFRWPIGDGTKEKVAVLRDLCAKLHLTPADVAYVGDHQNDLGVFSIVGLAIAFCSGNAELRKKAHATIDEPDLRLILPYLE